MHIFERLLLETTSAEVEKFSKKASRLLVRMSG